MTQCDPTRRAAFIIPILVVALFGLVAGAHAGITINIGDSQAEFEAFVAEEFNLSSDSARQFAGRVARENNARILDKWELPSGAVIDYFHVGQQAEGGPGASYTGSAVAVSRDSRMGRAYLQQVKEGSGVIQRVNDWLAGMLNPNSHLVLVPVGMLGPGMTHDMVAAMAGATQTRRIAIVGAEFPPWTDHSPQHGVTHEGRDNDNRRRYIGAFETHAMERSPFAMNRVRAFPMYWNLDTNFDGTVDAAESAMLPVSFDAGWLQRWAAKYPDAYADSPGGPFVQVGSYWRPTGIRGVEWHGDASEVMPDSPTWCSIENSRQNWTEFDLQNFWWNLLFNRSNAQSLTNYFYDNTHGNITIEGDRADVIGWVRSGHVMDRHPYQYNWLHAIQPGTPIIRPFLVVDGHAERDQRIVRASLDSTGLTVLFAEDIASPGTPVLYMHQQDLDGVTSGDQPGLTRIYGPSGASLGNTWQRDPYDHRRHKWVNNGWQYRRTGSSGPSWQTVSAAYADNTNFYFTLGSYRWGAPGQPNPTVYDNDYPAGGTIPNWATRYPTGTLAQGYRGSQGWGSVYTTVNRGSHQLYNTLFTTEDIYARNAEHADAWKRWESPIPDIVKQQLGWDGDQHLFGSWRDNANPEDATTDYGMGNRLKSFWYYHNSYTYSTGQTGYQLVGLRNSGNYRDDIGGTVESVDDRRGRPYPMNTNTTARPNMGFAIGPGSGGHDANAMVADVKLAMRDHGINIDAMGYNAVAYLFPNAGAGQEEGGGGRMMPRMAGYVLLPERSGLTLAAHEFGHHGAFGGMVDLYDNDLYNRIMTTLPPTPEFKECLAFGPYSVMTRSCNGVRIDAWHKLRSNWAQELVMIRDQLNMQVPMIESTLRDPVILKLPANPYAYLKLWDAVDAGTLDPNDADAVRAFARTSTDWREHFLVENRNRRDAAYYGDVSPQGMYIYHIDGRNIRYAPRQVSGFQVEERALSVAMVQADGMRDLETYSLNAGGTAAHNPPPPIATYTEGDPFPGADNVRAFSQIPTRLTRPVTGFVGERWSPTSWSHGNVIDNGPMGTVVIEPNTPTDSFSRIVNISDAGQTMTADVFVAPREVVCTNVSADGAIAPTLHAGTDLTQGDRLRGMLALKLDNPQYVKGSGDFSKMSTGEVVINSIRVLESGTAEQVGSGATIQPHPAVERAYIYAETSNPPDGFNPATDSRIGTATFGNTGEANIATFTSMGYRIPPDESRVLYVVYDIREDASITPEITVGAELTDYTFIIPAAPGAVAARQRLGGEWQFGNRYFPIVSATSLVIEAPDTLMVYPNPDPPGAGFVAPAQVSQAQQNVPLMQLRLHVNHDEVIIRSIKVDAAVGAQFVNGVTDLTVLRAYLDANRNGLIDPGERLLAESSFSLVDQGTPNERPQALLDLGDLNPIDLRTIVHSPAPEGDVYWLLSVDIGSDAPIGGQVQLRLETSDYVTLVTNPSFPAQDQVSPLNFEDDPALTESTVVSGLATVIAPNAPPNPPLDGFEPPHNSAISDRTPRFRWNPATDNPTVPGDPSTADDPSDLYYEIELATDAAMNNIIFSGNTSAAPGTTQFILPDANELPEPPETGTDYYWRLRTVDTEGARSPASTILRFTLIANQAPTAPVGGFWPAGGITITDDTPTYRWNHGTDPDLNDTYDTLLYRLQIDDNSDFSSPLVDIDDIPVPGGTLITDPVNFNPYDPPHNAAALRIGINYYWRVMTRDLQGTYSNNWSATQNFRVAENRAPYAPIAPFAPSGGTIVGSVRPTISWNTATPPDPDVSDVLDTIDFYIWVKDDANLDAGPYITQMHRQIVPGELDPGVTTVSMTVDVDLEDNGQYWYRIRARDLNGTGLFSDWCTTQMFYVNLQNDPPEAPKSGFVPRNGVTVNDATTTCSWDHAEDPDPGDDWRNIHYIVQWSPVGTSHADFEAALAYQVTTADGENFGTAPEALTDLQDWYWRVRSVDSSGAMSDWSAIQHYYLDTGNQAPELDEWSVTPYYGGLSTFFEYQVTYSDNENDEPGGVNVTINSGLPTEQTLPMAKVNPADNNYRNGVVYAVGLTGADLGYGQHTFVFWTVNGARSPAVDPDAHPGPTVGYSNPDQLWLKDQNWDEVGEHTVPPTRYEETDTIYIELYDEDEDLDPNAPDQVQVVVYDEAGTDAETVILTETGNSTGWFRGSIPIHGAPGAPNDGRINIEAGAAGKRVNVLYQDKDDTGNPYPDNPNPDRRTAWAMVEDTIGPVPITPAIGAAAAVLTVESGIHGRTATLDWTGYPEAAQIDLRFYYVYQSESNFGRTNDAGVRYIGRQSAGTMTHPVGNLEPGTDYWFAVVPVDEVPNPRPGNTAVTPIHLLTQDITAPTISNQIPAVDADEQELNVGIHFRISDPGVGLDFDSPLTITLDGVDITADVTITEIDGDRMVDCDYTPPQPFNWNDTPQIGVKVADKVGNLLDTTWGFAVLADIVNPLVNQLQPAAGATGVAVGSQISWHLTDAKSGIDMSTFRAELQGVDITADVVTTEVSGNKNIRCVYTPTPRLLYNSSYEVEVSIADVAGNQPAPTEWTFDTEIDDTGVAIDQFVPQRNATGVAVDTDISMRMTDREAGVNVDSIDVTVTVNGAEVAGELTTTIQGSSVNVVFNPAADFPHNTDVFVTVSVEDNVGNQTALTYSFRTAPPKTYVISGRILTASQAPVVGARIHWNGNAADDVFTDGNGSFLITGAIEIPGGYDITPTKDEWTFEPATQNAYVGPNDVGGVDFTGTLRTYAIRGTIADRNGVGLEGVRVAYGNSSVMTNAQGAYEIRGLTRGQYTLTPSKQHYHFDPVNRVVDVGAAAPADAEGVNFTAIPNTFSISGTVYNSAGGRVEGAEVSDGTNVAITNSAGRYTLANVAMGTHVLSARKLGYNIQPGQLQVTVPPDQTGQDFTAYLEVSNSFSAGLNLIGVPGNPIQPNPTQVFNTFSVFRWDPSASPAAYLSAAQFGDTDFMRVRPGSGFWVNFRAASTIAFAAEPTDVSRAASFGIGRGWNMIANPFASPTSFANFQPTVAGGIQPYAYVYNTRTGSYELVSAKSAINAVRSNLQPWEGAWILCNTGGTSMNVTASVGLTSADAQPEAADIGSGYVIPVTATAGGVSDTLGMAGLVPGSGGVHSLANPPAPPAGVDLYFISETGETLARDIRDASAGSETYRFVVSCGVGDADVTVALPDLSSVPGRYDIMLTDIAANRTIYARTMQAYTYQATADNPLRHFELSVAPKSVAALTVTTASATQQAQGVVISYNVSQACSVNMTVRNMAGRTVKMLSADKAAGAGLNSVVWTLRGDNGALVPSGSYLVQIEAVAANGQRAQALTRVSVNR